MRIGTMTLAAAGLVFVAAAAPSELKALGLQAGPAATGVVAERQDGMKKSGMALRAITGVIKANGDVKTVAAQAADLAAWSKRLPTLFPAGSTEGSHALPAVWTDNAGFKAKAAAFAAAAAKLAATTAAGDSAGAGAALGDVSKACGDCHGAPGMPLYRQPPPPRPSPAPAG